MQQRDVIIIGGGPAGRTIVHNLHQAGRNLSVTLIKDEKINANRCAVPYGISGQKPIEKFQVPNSLITDFGAELVVDRVTAVDVASRRVRTGQGLEFGYRHLVFATGARPVIPPIPGVEAPVIFAVRSIDDLARLRQQAAKSRRAVVIGGGYIGVEVAVVLRQMGVEVTIVEMLPQILMATTEPEFIAKVTDTLGQNGIRILADQKVVAFQTRSDNGLDVMLESGLALPADLVVLAVGVIPNTELAAAAGILTSRLGIRVDDTMRTSAEDVYACGDCAEKRSFVTGAPTRGEFGTNAVFMAKIVAQNILGNTRRFPGVINANAAAICDLSLGSAGLTEKMARDAGIDAVAGLSTVLDKYPMMDHVGSIDTKLVFKRENRKLIGGSFLRADSCTAQNVDFISLAIQMGATIDDLMDYQYATHPELAAKPSDNIYTFAAKDALSKL
ncbi:MAG TPA: NADH oxidase [Desulfobacteraceae bacterium]|nr:FAD-dependent oxidoreductase [Deltaproteobacteria bacterium]MBW2355401.1 FAD-dependent oxidoreductase [Deltaproteobacteria bacterium]RLB97662.1 MAG: NADH oxidase [Deltaproteobacteria bacterium]HDI60141.1 NADH oxidase [Desulfobacteraceae bacterium]